VAAGKQDKILIVDDEVAILKILHQKLETLGYDCSTESDGLRAVHRTKGERYNLILLDIKMPYVSGTELLRGLKLIDPDMSVVMISGIDSIELVRRTLREGAYDYLVKPLNLEELELTVRRALEHSCLLRERREYNRSLEKKVDERTKELAEALEETKRTYDATILALGSALETRDIETQAHSLRVAYYSLLLAEELGIEGEDLLTDIERGAYLHDIGKIGVPDEILRKRNPLSDEEWVVMKRHPGIGKRLIEGISFLRGTVPIVYCHHERFDGLGYPQGLKEDDVPVGARIFAIADTLDAMISDRPYRDALPLSKARELIFGQAGKQFDPWVVEGFRNLPEKTLMANSSTFLLNNKSPLRVAAALSAAGV
jgi:response regulator RpfG family c-di-GMP phosphodiesterase